MKSSAFFFLVLAGLIWLAAHQKLDPLVSAIVRGKK